MKKVKITVMKKTFNKELADQYGCSGIQPCHIYEVGQEFISEEACKPDGICEDAWTAFGKYVFALATGAELFWTDWIDKKHICINSCNDGLRPVIFKLEVIEDE